MVQLRGDDSFDLRSFVYRYRYFSPSSRSYYDVKKSIAKNFLDIIENLDPKREYPNHDGHTFLVIHTRGLCQEPLILQYYTGIPETLVISILLSCAL
jgi:hypothetical protein